MIWSRRGRLSDLHPLGLGELLGPVKTLCTIISPRSPPFVTQKKIYVSFLYTILNLYLPLPYILSTAIMCPSCNGDVVNGTNGHVPAATNGQANSTNGYGPHTPHNPRSQPFASLGDYLSNVSNFKIIESTLREGEQVSERLRFSV